MIYMSKVKDYLKITLLFILVLMIYLAIISIFRYYEVFNYKILNIVNYILLLILYFYSGMRISSIKKTKGYLNGFIIGIIITFIFAILSLILYRLNFSSLVYYLSLISSSILGGIIGVYIKKK